MSFIAVLLHHNNYRKIFQIFKYVCSMRRPQNTDYDTVQNWFCWERGLTAVLLGEDVNSCIVGGGG